MRIKRTDFDRLVEQGYSGESRLIYKSNVASIWDGEIPLPELPVGSWTAALEPS